MGIVAAGWSTDGEVTENTLTVDSDTESVQLPAYIREAAYLVVWTHDILEPLESLTIARRGDSSLPVYSDPAPFQHGGVDGQVRVSTSRRSTSLLSEETLRVKGGS